MFHATHRTNHVARCLIEKEMVPGLKSMRIKKTGDIMGKKRYIEKESEDRGSYLLVIHVARDKFISVGGLGAINFKRGFYIYAGSAMANLSKRIERHRRIKKRLHWHIDYLLNEAHLVHDFAIRSSERLECELAQKLSGIADWSIPYFGSSDCSCGSHLFGMVSNPLHTRKFHEVIQYFRMDRSFVSRAQVLR